MDNNTHIYSKESIEFATVAKEFLVFLESAKEITSEEFLNKSIKIIPLLYLKGALLPPVIDCDDDYVEKFVTENTWSYIQQVAAAKLEENDEYVQIQDAGVQNSLDYINVGLSELFADIYQEIGDFIGAYRTGIEETMLAALYYCKHNFESYWGIRALVLLKSLHEIKYKQENTDTFDL
jgi:hypothetical protein